MKSVVPSITFHLNYILGFIEALLLIRVILKALGANAEAIIVNIIYVLTDIINTPFDKMFSNIQLGNGGIFDVISVSAMIGYPILIFLVAEIITLVFPKFQD